jgi:hypothetical protein
MTVFFCAFAVSCLIFGSYIALFSVYTLCDWRRSLASGIPYGIFATGIAYFSITKAIDIDYFSALYFGDIIARTILAISLLSTMGVWMYLSHYTNSIAALAIVILFPPYGVLLAGAIVLMYAAASFSAIGEWCANGGSDSLVRSLRSISLPQLQSLPIRLRTVSEERLTANNE